MNVVHFYAESADAVHVAAAHANGIQATPRPDGSVIAAMEPKHMAVRGELSQIKGVTVLPHPQSHVKLNGLEKYFDHIKPTPPGPNHTIYEAFVMLGQGGLLHQDT